MPEFQNEKGPKRRRVIAPFALVLVKQHLDVTRLKVTALKRALRRQSVVNASAQLAIDPVINWHAKSHFPPGQDLVRDKARNRSREIIFRIYASQLTQHP